MINFENKIYDNLYRQFEFSKVKPLSPIILNTGSGEDSILFWIIDLSSLWILSTKQ